MIVRHYSDVIHEWVLEGDTWRNLGMHTELGVTADMITLTADGLRLIIARFPVPQCIQTVKRSAFRFVAQCSS